MPARAYAYIAMLMVGTGMFLAVYTLGGNKPEDSPRLGTRGLKRQRARATSPDTNGTGRR